MDRLIKIKRHRRSQRKCERIFKDLVCSSFLSPIFFINCIQVSGLGFTNNHYINYCANSHALIQSNLPTSGYLSTTATLFCPGGQSIYFDFASVIQLQ